MNYSSSIEQLHDDANKMENIDIEIANETETIEEAIEGAIKGAIKGAIEAMEEAMEEGTIEAMEEGTIKGTIKGTIEAPPHYRRLTFISMNACDFCTHVTKPGPYMHYLSFETKNGWVSCGDDACREKGKQAIEYFMKNKAYGRANYLKDRESIKVKRTSGQMDSDWLLERSYPEVQMDYNGVEKVCVTKPSACIEKWVSIDNLLSWNADE